MDNMVDQIFINGEALCAAVCPYHMNSGKVLSSIQALKAAGNKLYYSKQDLKNLLFYLDKSIKPAALILDHYPHQGSGPLQIEVAKRCKSPELEMYRNYTSFEAFRKEIETAPAKLGLLAVENLAE